MVLRIACCLEADVAEDVAAVAEQHHRGVSAVTLPPVRWQEEPSQLPAVARCAEARVTNEGRGGRFDRPVPKRAWLGLCLQMHDPGEAVDGLLTATEPELHEL